MARQKIAQDPTLSGEKVGPTSIWSREERMFGSVLLFNTTSGYNKADLRTLPLHTTGCLYVGVLLKGACYSSGPLYSAVCLMARQKIAQDPTLSGEKVGPTSIWSREER